MGKEDIKYLNQTMTRAKGKHIICERFVLSKGEVWIGK